MRDDTSNQPPLLAPAGRAGGAASDNGGLAGDLAALTRDLAAAHRLVQEGETVALAPLGAALVDICVRLQRLPPGDGAAFMPELHEISRLLDRLQQAIDENLQGLTRRIAILDADPGRV